MRAYNATYIELWRAENSFLRMRRNSDAQQGAACSKITLYSEGSNASSTSKTDHRAWRSGELIPQNERELRRSEGSGTITELWGAEKLGRSEGSGMLIGDPLVEGSSANSTDGELWRAENSFLGMRGTPLPMRSSRAENSLLRVRPITSSGEWRTHSSE